MLFRFKSPMLILSAAALFFGPIFATNDEITQAINKKELKKVMAMINNYKLLSNNKQTYLQLAEENLAKSAPIYGNNSFKKENLFAFLKSVSYLALTGTALFGAKAAFDNEHKPGIVFLSMASAFLGYQYYSEMRKLFNYSTELSDYYKDLAIKEELNKLV